MVANRTVAKVMPSTKTFRVLKPSPPPQVPSALLPSSIFLSISLPISGHAALNTSPAPRLSVKEGGEGLELGGRLLVVFFMVGLETFVHSTGRVSVYFDYEARLVFPPLPGFCPGCRRLADLRLS